MKLKDDKWTTFQKTLTNDDILAYAKSIGELRKKIDEAEEARKKLKNLQTEMSELTKILEQGELKKQCWAEASYHDPVEGMVTITPPDRVKGFEPIIRPMTPEELEKYCEHTLEFEEQEDSEKEIIETIIEEQNQEILEAMAVSEESQLPDYGEYKKWVNIQLSKPQEDVEEDSSSETIDDIAATVLDQLDYETYDPGTFVPENEELQEPIPNISVPVEQEQLSKVKVWKALNGGYFVFNEQQNPVPLKVLNSLENVVFLEQEGVDGVILKRHSEIIPSAINL